MQDSCEKGAQMQRQAPPPPPPFQTLSYCVNPSYHDNLVSIFILHLIAFHHHK